MEEYGTGAFLRRHIRAVLAAVAVVAVVAALSVTRCVSIHGEDAPWDAGSAEPEAETPGQGDGAGGDGEDAGAAATERQAAVIEAYGEDQEALLALLETGPWADMETGSTATFEDGALSVDGESLGAVALEDVSPEEGEDGGAESYTASVLAADGSSCLLTVKVGERDTVLECAGLLGEGEWYLEADAADVEVEAPDERTLEFLGIDADDLEDAVRECVAEERALASKATWDKSVLADLDGMTAGMSYELDDGHSSIVYVTVDLETGEIDAEAM